MVFNRNLGYIAPQIIVRVSEKSITESMTEFQIDERLDACGLACPLPLLKAKQALNKLQPGQILEVRATDAGSVRDFRAYADLSAHELLSTEEVDQIYIHILRRG